MQARFSTPRSLAAHHRRLMASWAESGCPQVRQRSSATSSARTVGESLCMSKSVKAHYKGQIVSARDLPTGCQQQCSPGSPHSTRATIPDRAERQVSSEAADEATETRRSARSAGRRSRRPPTPTLHLTTLQSAGCRSGPASGHSLGASAEVNRRHDAHRTASHSGSKQARPATAL
jgi:hypothetical protein